MSVQIFISAVSDEFRDYRDLLRRDLTRHNTEVKIQQDFKDYGGVTLDKLDLYIASCDAVVHLVGDMTGAPADPASTAAMRAKYPDIGEKLPPLGDALDRADAISYTQWEAWLALYHDKPLLIAQADQKAARGPKFSPTGASRAAQQLHLSRLQSVGRHPGCIFTSADNLAKQIALTTILDLMAEDRRASSPPPSREPPYGAVIAVVAVVPVMTQLVQPLSRAIGLALAVPVLLLVGLGGVALALLETRYFAILGGGAERKGSDGWLAYERLRASLATGGFAARLYSEWLTRFLDAVERFFGDAGMSDRTLLPRAFGLKRPAPLWTAPAFDRCLLLALLYPIATIFIMWAMSGHVGPAEAALGLKSGLGAVTRGFAVAFVGVVAFALWRGLRTTGWRSFVWLAFAFAFAVAVAVPVAVPVAVAVAFAGAVTGAGAVAVAVTFAVAVAVAGAVAFAGAAGVAVAFVVVVVGLLNVIAVRHQRRGVFLGAFLLTMLLACLVAPYWLSSLKTWDVSGPLLLYLGLLTLVNAPFDWASLGLTRALLRRGIELGRWWPYALALIDAVLAAGIVALLAIATVVAVQAFDDVAVRGAGPQVLPLILLFVGIAAHPAAPEYWWVYILLLSTMIPSLLNLAIGGTAFMRNIPGLPSLLLRFMPVGKAVPGFDRAWIATVLTLQVAVGVLFGIAAQAFLVVVVIGLVMPWVGLDLLGLARGVAVLDLPAQALQFFSSR